MDLAIGRRELLFGGALLGIGAGASTPAQACSRELGPYPWQGRFWLGAFERIFRRPHRARIQVHALLDAVLQRSAERIDAVLASDAVLIIPPSDSGRQQAGQVMERAAAVRHLSRIIDRAGARAATVNYLAMLNERYTFLVDSTLSGAGPYLPGTFAAAMVKLNPNGICGEGVPNDWQRRIVWRIVVDAWGRPATDVRVSSITIIEAY